MSVTRPLLFLLAAVVGVSSATVGYANKLPAMLTPSFADRDLRASKRPAPPIACAVRFGVSDGRTSKDIVGVIGQRAVLAPKDTQLWLRTVVSGFSARGIAPVFEGEPADAKLPLTTQLTLKTAWIDATAETYNASVVLNLQMQDRPDRSYRGRASRTAYWSMGVDTVQSAIDGAFANALDQIAPDLQQMCKA